MSRDAPHGLLFVARRDAARRVVVNELELAEALVGLGFRVIVPSELTAREQIAAFSGARIIVGAHGAAFANLVFAPARALVVELSSSGIMHQSSFRQLARTMDQRMVTIVSDEFEASDLGPNPSYYDYRVNVDEVLAVLRKEAPDLFASSAESGVASGAPKGTVPART
jgi:capsular polysaccharide biosynthesis protein